MLEKFTKATKSSDGEDMAQSSNPQTTSSPLGITRTLTVEYRTLSIRLDEARTRNDAKDDQSLQTELAVNFHKSTLHELSLRFNTSIENGLDATNAANRLSRNGKNQISPPPSKLLSKILDYGFGGFCGLLWFASLVCFLAWQPLGNPPDPTNLGLAVLILIVISLQAGFNAYQDWSSSKVMKSINNMLPANALVKRDGKKIRIPVSNLVVGDLVYLTYGNKVPADARMLSCSDIKFDKSVLTGESDPITGTVEMTDENYLESRNIALMGTLVTNGEGIALVVSTGDQTVMGKVAKLSSNSGQSRTLLQIEISRFVRIIATLSLSTALFVMILWVAWLRTSYPNFLNLSTAMVNAIAVLVAFVPEGLPVALTLTLTLVARRMQQQKVLVKNLTTVETLGSVNVIASDKTGTLTQNRMFVNNVFIDQPFSISDCRGYFNTKSSGVLQLLSVSGLCNSASFDVDSLNYPVSERKTIGDATDSALLRFSEEFNMVSQHNKEFTKLHEIPFNSKNKWMLTIAQGEKGDNCFGHKKPVLMLKGAPDFLFDRCTHVLSMDGTELELDQEAKNRLLRQQEEWSSEGQRVLLITRRFLEDQEFDSTMESEAVESLAQGMCIVGLVGIIDPPRPEIYNVVKTCRQAGIRLFMVTGDYSLTAAAIARKVGIITASHVDNAADLAPTKEQISLVTHDGEKSVKKALVLSGADLPGLSEQQWDTITHYDEIVFARTTPEQKLRIVQEFQQRGNIVGVTGDGVNDAPALKAANIGIAMGSGSEVAMEAAHMVLLDNNFSSIIVAIENGRLVYDNLKKVILYLLPAGSWSELIPILVNFLLGVPLPLSAFLMICICVLTDMLPSVAMMFETAESDLLQRPPRRPSQDRLVNFKLLRHAYLFTGLMETFFSHAMFFYYIQSTAGLSASDILLQFDKWTDGYKGMSQAQLDDLQYTGQCVTFVTLVILQSFGNLLGARTRRLSILQHPPWAQSSRNLWLFGAQVGSVVLALLAVYLPVFNNIFNTRPVPVQFWFIPLAGAMIILGADETRKYFVRKYPKGVMARLAW
ncbi:calcium ATPase [Basidiobolus meristosporus CBS 931.73]|uniref:Calcium ATPase n=1 Tax=Basidiobolus meristosporus CBS 931.73 TaxID=1314790 RepID=A0A1Y1Z5B7_9FUNG|nr:calcium ATPase [Basidiobolus meristosporus CBS 931.73]|eukprot:ORY05439.1 calcium ATPase [Basidiobolus meristosporus CBS 931.73]